MVDRDIDYLIVGQGLAGSALAMALRELNVSVVVLDREDANSASRVAAGLVTTVAGKGMNLGWRQAEYLPEALAYYKRLERQYGVRLFLEHEVLRLFENDKQAAKYDRKKESLAGWVADAEAEDLKRWNGQYGGFLMLQGGWLNTGAYLKLIREILGDNYSVADFVAGDLEIGHECITYRNIRAKEIILCQGASGLTEESGLFSYLEHRSAKGEILKVRLAGQSQDKIVNRNGWMVPVGEDEWRVGATYEWSDMSGNTSSEGRAEVENKLRDLTDMSYQITEHVAGVRPIMRKSQPYVGTHPDHQRVRFFNGLGSKGVVTAPSVARHFANHLVNGMVLDDELSL